MTTNIPRPEYPRPDFERVEWLNLNGEWEFEFDDGNIGEEQSWYHEKELTKKILVPYAFQSELSGINSQEMHEILWYIREFELPASFSGKRLLLNFGAVDYEAKVWVNGEWTGGHRGGHTPFKMDVTDLVKQGINTIVVRAEDRYECVQPRGKQYWKQKPDRCLSTSTSGIWQTVWLEMVGEFYIDRLRITPDTDNRNVQIEVYLNKAHPSIELECDISYKGTAKKKHKLSMGDRISKFTIAYASIDAPPYQSGQFVGTNRHISKRGSAVLRKVGYETMRCLKATKNVDDSVYQFMIKKESEGKPKKVAKVAGLNKFLRIYYARVKEVYQ